MTHHDHHAGPGYASPEDALRQPPEEVAYVACLYEGTGIQQPDFLAVVDVDPESDTYSEIVHRTPMPNVGDELHHYGWRVCSSACHSGLARDSLIVPGFRSSRIHILDVSDPRRPGVAQVIEPEEVTAKTGLTGPHTVHCMPGDIVTISMLGDANGDAPGGFAVLDAADFSVLGRWEVDRGPQELMYDFWYQPRAGTLIASEWAAPNTFRDGFDPADVAAGRYGRRLHFYDLERKAHVDLVLSMNDRDLFFSNWLHGDLRHYDVSDPENPRLRSQVWLGGLLGRDGGHPKAEGPLNGGPQMVQVSLDGERVYVTNSLYSTWDNQFYPGLRGWMTKLDRQPDGTYALVPDFFVDFGKLDTGPARPHEIHLPGGDCTTEIFP